MKKRISRIQRWLDRLSIACEKGRWDSALVEADCLSAEVREIREDLTLKLENECTAPARIFSRSAVSMSIRSAGIALLIILISTIPLSVESERPWTAQTAFKPAKSSGREMLAWVTREEDELIKVLRSDLSGQNAALNPQGSVFSVSVPKRSSVLPVQDGKRNVILAEKPAAGNKTSGSETGISQEDLLALVQIGEKAIRGDAPAIKVIK